MVKGVGFVSLVNLISIIFRSILSFILIAYASQAWAIGNGINGTYGYDSNVVEQSILLNQQKYTYDASRNLSSGTKTLLSRFSGKTILAGSFFAFVDSFSVAKKGGQTFERVVSKAELKATQNSGLLRGGREGENFFTNSASLNAKRAQQQLGLDGPLRDARIRFKIKNDAGVTGPRPAAPGRTGTAGGGREFSTNGRTEIEILRVDPLQ